VKPGRPRGPESTWNRSRLLHVAANLGVATTFVATLAPWVPQLLSTAPKFSRANLSAGIWITGALTMALLSLTRAAPREARTDYQALIATSAMMVLPLFMRPATRFAATNWPTLEAAGTIFQVVGLPLMLVGWLYLGRHFGLLPANRGLVVRGPFRLIRHPVYAAWLLTALGTSMAAPSVRNFALVALTIPFMVWRIALEEELLDRDAQYLAYRQRVRWRLVPGMF
jgi:protein-S-isoprenylcysteine O-methyltransferase Ste14